MIQTIEIKNFKSLRQVSLKLGALNLFIGTNSSGKSNFLDALRVLQGIGYGFTFDEILNGKPRSASTEVWEPIRGGSSKATYSEPAPNDHGGALSLSFCVRVQAASRQTLTYQIAFFAQTGDLYEEALSGPNGKIYSTAATGNVDRASFDVLYYPPQEESRPILPLDTSRPILQQLWRRSVLTKPHEEVTKALATNFTNVQRIEPVLPILRDYSVPHSVRRMGEHGENFAALVKTILNDPAAKSGYLSWLQNLTPTEVDDVMVLDGALGEPLFAVKEREQVYPAPVLSDGTLRFAAIAAAFFQPDMPDMITIEGIENGIHPTRLRLLVELLRSQAVQTERQIIATTHSPVVLAWLSDEDYETTFFCKRDEKTGESIIKPLAEIPHFIDTVKKQSLADLFAEGWLEGAL